MLSNYFKTAKSQESDHTNSSTCDPQYQHSMGVGPGGSIVSTELTPVSEDGYTSVDGKATNPDLVGSTVAGPHDELFSGISPQSFGPNLTVEGPHTDTPSAFSLETQGQTLGSESDMVQWPPDASQYFQHLTPMDIESASASEMSAHPFGNDEGSGLGNVSFEPRESISAMEYGPIQSPSRPSSSIEHSMLVHTPIEHPHMLQMRRMSDSFLQNEASLGISDTGLDQNDSYRDVASANSVPTSVEKPSNLSAYRVGDIPPFRGRSQSSPPSYIARYTLLANWPPPKPSSCELGSRLDVFPPKDAPLHVWIQAYALRWGTWTADIKDDTIREQVLAAVTDKMKMAWETAITEGYYARPSENTSMSHQRSDSDGQNQRTRKRAQSPSKLPAGLAFEGKDKYAVTNGELAEHGITIEMIDDRVQRRDFEAGELRYDEVLDLLGRDQISVSDWSTSISKVVPGRNLLMYCFFAVEESRAERARMENLLKRFTKEGQKKNTLHRIEIAQEREFQHMALATELTIREDSQPELYESENDKMDASEVDLTSDVEGDQENTSGNIDCEAFEISRDSILDLARDVLTASTEASCQDAFTSRQYSLNDFTAEGLNVGNSEKYQKAKISLGNIFERNSNLLKLKQKMKAQQPSEALKIGHEVRLCKERIKQQQQVLQKVLSDEIAISSTKIFGSEESSPEGQSKLPPKHTELQPLSLSTRTESVGALDHAAAREATSPNDTSAATVTVEDQAPPQISNVDSSVSTRRAIDPVSSQTLSYSPRSEPHKQLANITNPSTLHATQRSDYETSGVAREMQATAVLKQEYINECWVPFLKSALADHGLPPFQGVVDSWNPIKQVMAQIGMSADERNIQLRRFKDGFIEYLARKGKKFSDISRSQSPIPTSLNASSPSPSHPHTQLGKPLSWPTDIEILTAIPPQGTPAAQLMQFFNHRLGPYRQQFMQAVERLAIVDKSSYMVFPRTSLPAKSTDPSLLSLQSSRNLSSAQQQGALIHHASRPPTPARPRPGLVRLKVPQSQAVVTTAQLPLPQDESTMPEEMKSTDVNSSRGFTFRHLPHAAYSQRLKMDDHIGDYIAKTCRSRKKNPFGQYIVFRDPEDSSGPPIAHGFWSLQDNARLQGVEWFYNGEDIPADWNFNCTGFSSSTRPASTLDQGQTQLHRHRANTNLQQPPKIKLKLNNSTTESAAARQSTQSSAYSSPYAEQQHQQFGVYDVLPPGYTAANTNPTANYGAFSDQVDSVQLADYQYGTQHPATINPALLTKDFTPSAHSHSQNDIAQAPDNAGPNMKKGTKRSAATSQAGGRKKKRRTNTVDDDDEYDPSQDE